MPQLRNRAVIAIRYAVRIGLLRRMFCGRGGVAEQGRGGGHLRVEGGDEGGQHRRLARHLGQLCRAGGAAHQPLQTVVLPLEVVLPLRGTVPVRAASGRSPPYPALNGKMMGALLRLGGNRSEVEQHTEVHSSAACSAITVIEPTKLSYGAKPRETGPSRRIQSRRWPAPHSVRGKVHERPGELGSEALQRDSPGRAKSERVKLEQFGGGWLGLGQEALHPTSAAGAPATGRPFALCGWSSGRFETQTAREKVHRPHPTPEAN